METIINKYVQTKDLVKEYQNAWWKNYFKKGIIVMSIILLVSIILFIQCYIKYNLINVGFIALIAICVLYFILLYLKKEKAIKMELKRYNALFNNQDKEIKIKLQKSIEIEIDKNKREIFYDKVKNYIETKNLIILLVEGNMTISLKKDAFTKGSYEECKELLNNEIKGVKKCIKHGKN